MKRDQNKTERTNPLASIQHKTMKTYALLVLLTALTGAAAQAGTMSYNPKHPAPAASTLVSSVCVQDPALARFEWLVSDTAPEASINHIIVSIADQRLYAYHDQQLVAWSNVSSGKPGHETPTGSFTVLEKDPNHRSTLYGAFCDSKNRIVRAGVSLHIDSAPSGTHFIGAPMLWFCRFHDAVGMHVGILPGYAASHGCVRLPANIAPLIYQKVKVGTPVEVDP